MSEFRYSPELHPLLKSLPSHLKDHTKFYDIQKKILETIMTSCTHSDLVGFAKCSKCTKNMLKRRKLLRDLGFKNPAQYMAWRMVHEEIKKKVPLVQWKPSL
jgi:hypothetical protein